MQLNILLSNLNLNFCYYCVSSARPSQQHTRWPQLTLWDSLICIY